MYSARDKVIWFAVISRLAVTILQFMFNLALPDHDAGVFLTPMDPAENVSIYDTGVHRLLSGLLRWDAHYFVHIAKHGYTYENTLAFSPLYPISVRHLGVVLRWIFFVLNSHSATILAAFFINFISFVKSAAILYDLSKMVLMDGRLAYKAAILYCINPASIFFSAFYTESIFAYVTFQAMLAFTQNNPYIYLPIGLSAIVRSNGLINIGFPLYSFLRSVLRNLIPKFNKRFQNNLKQLPAPYGCRTTLSALFWLLNIIFLSAVPYILLQLYNYSLFCMENEFQMPAHVLKYGLDNDFLIAGTEKPPWCENSVPMSYSYVQNKYWDVGFMRYYTLKQVPNFLLAFPILYVMLMRSLRYLNEHRVELFSLGSFSQMVKGRGKSNGDKYPSDMFVFVIHGLFLTLFCIFFVHIQVSTRLLCSASPLLYWYCAFDMSAELEEGGESSTDFECRENSRSKWKVFFLTQKKYSNIDIAVVSYFVGYVVTGCVMFPNFLPWT